MTTTAIQTETPAEEKRRLRKVATATIVGTTVEWFDFYLYASMASIVIAKVFFPAGDSQLATIQASVTFAVGFIARPLGGIIFGAMGDQIGRKKTLIVTFMLMGISTAIIGILPTFDAVGYWAPALLLIVRIFQGMGAGAEYAGAAVVSYEHARSNKRGSQGAWPALGLNLGLVLSSFTIFLLTLNGDEFLISGGWRIPFVLSILLVAVGLWVRRSMPESPEYERLSEAGAKSKRLPFKALIAKEWRGLLVVVVLAIGYNAVSYIFKSFSLSYITEYQKTPANLTASAVTIAGVVAIIAVPIFGWLCDRFSAKLVIAAGAVLSMVFAFPFLALLESGEPAKIMLAIGIGTGIVAPMMFSAQGAFLSRQFPTETRSSGVGSGREIGTAIGAGLAPTGSLVLVAASATNATTGVGVVLTIAGLLILIPALLDQGKRHSTDKN
jgi:MFS family permease